MRLKFKVESAETGHICGITFNEDYGIGMPVLACPCPEKEIVGEIVDKYFVKVIKIKEKHHGVFKVWTTNMTRERFIGVIKKMEEDGLYRVTETRGFGRLTR